jgi:hypothetical protein
VFIGEYVGILATVHLLSIWLIHVFPLRMCLGLDNGTVLLLLL